MEIHLIYSLFIFYCRENSGEGIFERFFKKTLRYIQANKTLKYKHVKLQFNVTYNQNIICNEIKRFELY